MTVGVVVAGGRAGGAVQLDAQLLTFLVGHHGEVEGDVAHTVDRGQRAADAVLDLVAQGAPGDRQRDQDVGRAAAIDLESGAVARAAISHNLPFAILRVICDPAERDLPPAALTALNNQGAIGLLRVIGSLFANPRQFPALMTLAADAAAARQALAARVAAIGQLSISA